MARQQDRHDKRHRQPQPAAAQGATRRRRVRPRVALPTTGSDARDCPPSPAQPAAGRKRARSRRPRTSRIAAARTAPAPAWPARRGSIQLRPKTRGISSRVSGAIDAAQSQTDPARGRGRQQAIAPAAARIGTRWPSDAQSDPRPKRANDLVAQRQARPTRYRGRIALAGRGRALASGHR